MIKINGAVIVEDNGLDSVDNFSVCIFARNLHGVDQLSLAKPTIKHVKEVYSVFNEYSPTLFSFPKPMFRNQFFIAGIVFKKSMDKITQPLLFNNSFHSGIQRIIPLHQVDRIEESIRICISCKFFSFAGLQGSRLLTNDMLASM